MVQLVICMLSSNEILSQGMQPNSKLDLKYNDPAQLETDVPNHFFKSGLPKLKIINHPR